jgi:hypothetical protein
MSFNRTRIIGAPQYKTPNAYQGERGLFVFPDTREQ